VLVIAVVLVFVVTADEDRPIPPGAIPTLGNQFATPPTSSANPDEPNTTDTLPTYSGNPLWTVQLPGSAEDYDIPGIAVTDAGYVLESREQLVGISRAGTQLWTWTPPKVDYFTTKVTGSTVFVSYSHPTDDRWPQPEIIIALDSATGKERWREDEASLWSVSTDAIYLSVCYGGQNTRIGDCTLTARDPLTNAVRWSAKTYASARVENLDGLQAPPTPPYLLVGAYPTNGGTYVVAAHDPATGRVLGRGWESGSLHISSPDTLFAIDARDENPADGCQATVTGYRVTGPTQTWQQQASTAKTDTGKRCAAAPTSVNNGRMAITTPAGLPAVLNVSTGGLEWTGPAEGVGVAASDTTLLAMTDKELVAYQVGIAEPLWRTRFDHEPGDITVALTPTTAALYGSGYPAVGYDLKTGKGWTYGKTVHQSTPSSFVVCGKGSCAAYQTR